MIFQIRILRFIKQLKIKQFIKPRTLMLITCVLSFNQIVAQKIIFERVFISNGTKNKKNQLFLNDLII